MSAFSFFDFGQVQDADLVVFLATVLIAWLKTISGVEAEGFLARVNTVSNFALLPMVTACVLILVGLAL